jgi:uncharacterized protein (TIGR03663 family)
MNKAVFCTLMAISLAAAASLRLDRLGLRPMHHDEANQAVKFGLLLEHGEYHYDRTDHHGPTLYYLTLPIAWARGQKTLSQIDETTLRLVPALFGSILILVFLPLAGGLGRGAVCITALLAALSPAMSYFSRFYIQEALFICFALGLVIAAGRYAMKPKAAWALIAGICAGMSFATKETSVLVFSAAFLSVLLCRDISSLASVKIREHLRHLIFACLPAFIIVIALYSSFFTNRTGILDSILAFREYATRGFQDSAHAHPWYYYWNILLYSSSGGLAWSEGLILVLAILGTWFSFRGTHFWPRYIVLYSWILAAMFSVIRLKTPWNVLPFLVGFTLMAGYGMSTLLEQTRFLWLKVILVIGFGVGLLHLGKESWMVNFRYPADPRNPYVYAQTVPDFLRLAQRVHELAALQSDGNTTLIKVVAGPYEQWPLPWYLRDLGRVGYWTNMADCGSLQDAPIVIASQENAPQVGALLGDNYQGEYYGLRPEEILTLYIENSLWKRFLIARSQ